MTLTSILRAVMISVARFLRTVTGWVFCKTSWCLFRHLTCSVGWESCALPIGLVCLPTLPPQISARHLSPSLQLSWNISPLKTFSCSRIRTICTGHSFAWNRKLRLYEINSYTRKRDNRRCCSGIMKRLTQRRWWSYWRTVSTSQLDKRAGRANGLLYVPLVWWAETFISTVSSERTCAMRATASHSMSEFL